MVAGQTATFTAAATGTPTPTVQWQVSPTAARPSPTSPARPPPPFVHGRARPTGNRYRAVFTNTWAAHDVQGDADGVDRAGDHTAAGDSTVLAGQSASFTAAATGTPADRAVAGLHERRHQLHQHLRRHLHHRSFTTAQAESGNKYRAVFTNAGGNTTSAAATLTVVTPPSISQQPTDRQRAPGRRQRSARLPGHADPDRAVAGVNRRRQHLHQHRRRHFDDPVVHGDARPDRQQYRAVFTNIAAQRPQARRR